MKHAFPIHTIFLIRTTINSLKVPIKDYYGYFFQMQNRNQQNKKVAKYVNH